MQYRQVQAQEKGRALNEAGYRQTELQKLRLQERMVALDETGHRQMQYRQVQAQEKGRALNEAGYRQTELQKLKHLERMNTINEVGSRAAQLTSLKQGLSYGPDRSTLYQLRDSHAAVQLREQEAAQRKATAATQAAIPHTVNHTKALNDAHSAARGLASGFGAMWLTWGNIGPLLAGAAISNGLVQATKAGSEFAYQLTFVKALGGESAEAVASIGRQTLELSKNSLFGPVELANGLRMLAQAGLSAQESIATLPTVMDLATVGEMTMAESGLILAGVMNAFRLETKDMEHIGDVFGKAAAVSQTSVQQMTQAMRMASVVGEQYGATMEDTATALTLLAKVNITGTAAGTSLRNMLKELYTPTDGVAKVMKQLGLHSADAAGNMRPFADIIFELKDKLKEFDKSSQAAILQKLFGERGAKEAIVMLSQTRDEWDKLNQTISQSKGFIKGVSDELENTAKGTFKQALSTLQASLVEAFQGAEVPLKEMAQAFKDLAGSPQLVSSLTTLLNTFAALGTVIANNLPMIISIGEAWLMWTAGGLLVRSAAGIAELGMGFTRLATGMALASSGQIGWSALAAASLGPIGLIAIALGGGALAYYNWADAAEKAAKKAADSMHEAAKSMTDDLNEVSRTMHENSAKMSQGKLDAVGTRLAKANEELSAMRDQVSGKYGITGIGSANDWLSAVAAGDAAKDDKFRAAAAFKQAWEEREAVAKRYYTMKDELEKKAAAEAPKPIQAGTKKFEMESGRDLKSQVAAQQSAALAAFNSAEKDAKAEYDFRVKLANDALSRENISQEQFLQKRFEAENEYINRVYTAKEEAETELGRLRNEADRKSQQTQLDNASAQIGARIRGQGIQDAFDQKLKLGVDDNKIIQASRNLSKQTGVLGAASARDRQIDWTGRDSALLSSGDVAALQAEVRELDRFGPAIAKANEELKAAEANHDMGSIAVEGYRTKLAELVEQQNQSIFASKEAARALDDYHRSMSYGMKEAFATYVDGATNAAEQTRSLWGTSLKGMESELAKFIRTGKADWRGYANMVLDELARIAAAKMTAGIVSTIAGAFSGGGGAGSMSGNGSVQGNSDYVYDLHSGGIAGSGEGSGLYARSAALFRGAPRYHGGGLAADETPAVLQKGEGVFTAGQMRKLAPVGSGTGGNTFQVNISVDAKGTKSEGDAGAASNLARKLEGEMRRILVNEMRPGGLLENA
jgi:TP901 family phage tail tape measure protein/lambda family phage tail tape measure protein